MAEEQPLFPEVAAEILRMVETDQAMRRAAAESAAACDPEVDRRHTARMREIVSEIGWPTCSKVGLQAEHGAWLLVQHADRDADFQPHCLELMRNERPDEVCRRHIAYLDDRIRVHRGRPQLYGTQFTLDPNSGSLVPKPIENEPELDRRRGEMGLPPFESYRAEIEKHFP